MKDNRMRQTRNKWNNRGPRQVKPSIAYLYLPYANDIFISGSNSSEKS